MKRSSTSLIREAQIKTTDVSPQTCQDGHYHHHHKKKKNLQTVNAREGVEKRELSYTVSRNENW